MRKILAGFLIISLFLGIGFAKADYSEKFEGDYKIDESGNANVTFITTWLAPEDLINQSKEYVRNVSVENATKVMLSAELRSLKNSGINLENATLELKNYDNDQPLKKIVRGVAVGFSKYYSYDDVWEFSIDALRLFELSNLQLGSLTETIEFENYYKIELPQGVQVLEAPKSFTSEAGNSKISIETKVNGNIIEIHSYIKIAANESRENLQTIFTNITAPKIAYKGIKGNEVFSEWKAIRTSRITVHDDYIELNNTEKYLSPADYLFYLRLQIMQLGVENATQMIKQNTINQYAQQGIKVRDGSVKILGLENTSNPLEIDSYWALENYTKKNDTDIYEYPYNPTLGLKGMNFEGRLTDQVNQTARVEFILPENGKFVEVPQEINKELNGNRVVLKVTQEGNKLVLESTVFLRYGTPREDFEKLMSDIPDQVVVGYSLESKKAGVCGPGIILGFALLPLIGLRKRK